MKSRLIAPAIAALLGICALAGSAATTAGGPSQGTAQPAAQTVPAPAGPDFSKLRALLRQQSQERGQFNRSRKADMKAYAASLKGLSARQRFAALARKNQDWESRRQAMVQRQRAALESARKQARSAAAKP